MPNSENRIKFFSINDGSIPHYYPKIESLLGTFDPNADYDINDVLEFYNIECFFKNGKYPPGWDNNKQAHYKNILAQAIEISGNYFSKINDISFIEIVTKVNSGYRSDFWEVINNYSIYKKLSSPIIGQFLEQFPRWIIYILPQKNVVEKFGQEIKVFLLQYESAAELLLREYEEKHNSNNYARYCFPKQLTEPDRETILLNYLNSADPNLNYVRLIEHSRTIKLSNKTKLAAKKLSEKLNDEIIQTNSVNYTLGVALSEDQAVEKPVLFLHHENIYEYSYSKSYLDSIQDLNSQLGNFRSLFAYLDNMGLIALVNKDSESYTLESIFMQSKGAYNKNMKFSEKDSFSFAKLILFDHYLKNNRSSNIEEAINLFISKIINKSFTTPFRELTFSHPQASFLEKINNLNPQIESLLKQYKFYANEGHIDWELFSIETEPTYFKDIKSLFPIKNVYNNGSETINMIRYFLYSDQSPLVLSYLEKDYPNFYSVLANNKIVYDTLESFQKIAIDQLINNEILKIEEDQSIGINNIKLVLITGMIDKYGSINYMYMSYSLRSQLDDMIRTGELIADNNLFSKHEIDYLNYNLNNKSFTDGPNLRNKYSHGTYMQDENEYKRDYYSLIRVLILIILKIYEDLMFKKMGKFTQQ